MKRAAFNTIIVLMILLGVSTSAFAQATAGERLDAETVDELSEYYGIERISQEEQRDFIYNFDISDDGRIAVLYENSIYSLGADPKKSICIYDIEGNFLCGWQLYCAGSMDVRWIDGYPAVYDIRSSALSPISEKGEILASYDCKSAMPRASVCEYGEKTYRADGASDHDTYSYKNIVEVDKDGNERVIISVKGRGTELRSAVFFAVILAAAVVLGIIVGRSRRKIRESGENDESA